MDYRYEYFNKLRNEEVNNSKSYKYIKNNLYSVMVEFPEFTLLNIEWKDGKLICMFILLLTLFIFIKFMKTNKKDSNLLYSITPSINSSVNSTLKEGGKKTNYTKSDLDFIYEIQNNIFMKELKMKNPREPVTEDFLNNKSRLIEKKKTRE